VWARGKASTSRMASGVGDVANGFPEPGRLDNPPSGQWRVDGSFFSTASNAQDQEGGRSGADWAYGMGNQPNRSEMNNQSPVTRGGVAAAGVEQLAALGELAQPAASSRQPATTGV